jgi:UDP-2-acetamido-3-amino-2,3-dideoxy-glucuronate N-acetyltransferase
MKYYAHESTVIDEGAVIGDHSSIWHFCHVMAGAVVGSACSFGQNVFVASGAIIGNRCRIQNNVSIYEGVILGDEVFCGPGVVFTNVRHPRAAVPRKSQFEVTRIETGATLGANSTIVCGVTIGCFAFVAAGAVVNRDVSPHAVVAGVPARQIGWACECGETLRAVERGMLWERCKERYSEGSAGLQKGNGDE